jgi:L-alanine-DL-glutamate epimerase-like enolase superfamily enzyme
LRIEHVEFIPFATRRMIKGSYYGRSLFYLVKMRANDGITGIGEASDILHGLPPDIGYLTEWLNRRLSGLDPFNTNQVEAVIQSTGIGPLCEGLDTALHDLLGKALKVPVYALLGGKVRDSIPIAFPFWAIRGKQEVRRKIDELTYLVDRGIKTIRIYVGANIEADMNLLKDIRDKFEYDVLIRSLDLSNRFTPKRAIRFIKRAEKYEFMYAESPCKDLKGMAEVRRAVDTPISQHVATLEHALAMIENRSVDIFNIGVAGGGLTQAKKQFVIAEAGGVECVVGTTQEMTIGTSAQAHLIASTPNVHYPCDPAGPLIYEKDITKTRLDLGGGILKVPEGIGLGIELDEERLKQIRVDPEDQKSLMLH